MSLVTNSRRINRLTYNGKLYSTLADVAVNTSGTLCQSSLINIPAGWVVAAGNIDSQTVIGAHWWSTTFLVVSTGRAFRTGVGPGSCLGSGYLVQSGSLCKPAYRPMQVLISTPGELIASL